MMNSGRSWLDTLMSMSGSRSPATAPAGTGSPTQPMFQFDMPQFQAPQYQKPEPAPSKAATKPTPGAPEPTAPITKPPEPYDWNFYNTGGGDGGGAGAP